MKKWENNTSMDSLCSCLVLLWIGGTCSVPILNSFTLYCEGDSHILPDCIISSTQAAGIILSWLWSANLPEKKQVTLKLDCGYKYCTHNNKSLAVRMPVPYDVMSLFTGCIEPDHHLPLWIVQTEAEWSWIVLSSILFITCHQKVKGRRLSFCPSLSMCMYEWYQNRSRTTWFNFNETKRG